MMNGSHVLLNNPVFFYIGSLFFLYHFHTTVMDWHALLRFVHITSFAIWFGSVFASLFVLKVLEPKLTGPSEEVADFPGTLQNFIKLETKVGDTGFKTAVVSGLLLAFFYHGWTVGILVKSILIILQVALTMGYIIKAIHPLSYPCSGSDYRKWYNLFTISLLMFALVLGVTFFLL